MGGTLSQGLHLCALDTCFQMPLVRPPTACVINAVTPRHLVTEPPLLLEIAWQRLTNDRLIPLCPVRSKVCIARQIARARAVAQIRAMWWWVAVLSTLATLRLLCRLPIAWCCGIGGQITCWHTVEGRASRIGIERMLVGLLARVVSQRAQPQRPALPLHHQVTHQPLVPLQTLEPLVIGRANIVAVVRAMRVWVRTAWAIGRCRY